MARSKPHVLGLRVDPATYQAFLERVHAKGRTAQQVLEDLVRAYIEKFNSEEVSIPLG